MCCIRGDALGPGARGRGRSGLPYTLERGAPRDELIQHPVQGLLVTRMRLEDPVALEVVVKGQLHLRPDVRDLQLAHDEAQALDRAHAAGAAVADEAGRLV